jgi:hypothetical protein
MTRGLAVLLLAGALPAIAGAATEANPCADPEPLLKPARERLAGHRREAGSEKLSPQAVAQAREADRLLRGITAERIAVQMLEARVESVQVDGLAAPDDDPGYRQRYLATLRSEIARKRGELSYSEQRYQAAAASFGGDLTRLERMLWMAMNREHAEKLARLIKAVERSCAEQTLSALRQELGESTRDMLEKEHGITWSRRR